MQSQTISRPAHEVAYYGKKNISSRVLQGIQALPTLPHVLTNVINTMEDESASAADLERVIRQDQAMCSKLLSVANSAYYGFVAEITTLKRAVVVLGLSEVRKVCLGAGIFNMLNRSRVKNYKLVEEQWAHSLAVAEGARILAARTKKAEPEQAFTSGLLHDLGKLALAAFFPEEFQVVAQRAADEGITFQEAEAELGVDHEDVGISLAEHWHFPPMLSEVLGRHHEPYPGLSYLELVAAVHVADCLVHELWPQGDGVNVFPYPEAVKALDMSEEDMWWVRKRLQKRAEAIESLRQNL